MNPRPEPSRRPRVVFFCRFPPPNTGQTIGTELTRRLLAEHVDCEVFDTSGGGFVFGSTPLYALRRVRALVRRLGAMIRHLKTERIDVLYLVTAGSVGGHLRDALTILRARRHVPRIVAHVRSGEFPLNFARRWQRPLAAYVFSRVDRFIFLSDDLARQVERHIPESRRTVIPNCIDEAVRCTTEEVAAKLESRRERTRFRVLYLANMLPAKGYWDVAEAVGQVISREPRPAVEVDFAGAWPSQRDRETFERFLHDRGLAGATRLHAGVTDREQVKQLLLAADVLVLPTYYPEAQPRSIIEAMNAATPIIACPEASIPEYVHHGVNGYLVEPKSPDQIAQAIELLLDPTTWRTRAEAARRIYLETFDPARIQKLLLAAVLDRPEADARTGH